MKAFVAGLLAVVAHAAVEDMPQIDVNDFTMKTFDNFIDHFNY
jgi:pimeloyl-ACP methyl ester carboxylesterase